MFGDMSNARRKQRSARRIMATLQNEARPCGRKGEIIAQMHSSADVPLTAGVKPKVLHVQLSCARVNYPAKSARVDVSLHKLAAIADRRYSQPLPPRPN